MHTLKKCKQHKNTAETVLPIELWSYILTKLLFVEDVIYKKCINNEFSKFVVPYALKMRILELFPQMVPPCINNCKGLYCLENYEINFRGVVLTCKWDKNIPPIVLVRNESNEFILGRHSGTEFGLDDTYISRKHLHLKFLNTSNVSILKATVLGINGIDIVDKYKRTVLLQGEKIGFRMKDCIDFAGTGKRFTVNKLDRKNLENYYNEKKIKTLMKKMFCVHELAKTLVYKKDKM